MCCNQAAGLGFLCHSLIKLAWDHLLICLKSLIADVTSEPLLIFMPMLNKPERKGRPGDEG